MLTECLGTRKFEKMRLILNGGPERLEGGRPLLTVKIEANGDSRSTNEIGPSLIDSLGSLYRYKRFLSCLDCCSRPSKKYVFPHFTHYFRTFVPIAQPAGQAVMLGHLSLNVCLWGGGGREE